jgi:hypothetical protein
MTAMDGLGTTHHLNRLAGTIVNGVPTLDAQGAAQKWCANNSVLHNNGGTAGCLNLLYASRNGGKNYWWDLQGVLNGLAGTWGLGEADAAARIVS